MSKKIVKQLPVDSKVQDFMNRTNDNLEVLARSGLELANQHNALVLRVNLNAMSNPDFVPYCNELKLEIKALQKSMLGSRVLTGTLILMQGITLAVLYNQPVAIIAGALGALIYYSGTDA